MGLRPLRFERRAAPFLSAVHLLWATLSALAFLAILVVLDALADDFDPLTDTISAHAGGPGKGWINLAFIVAGLAVMPAGYPLTWVVRSRIARFFVPLLFLVGGLAIAGLAFYPAGPEGSAAGRIHLTLAATGITAILLGALEGAWAFTHKAGWPHGGFISTTLAGITLGTYGVALVVALSGEYAPTSSAIQALGLVERAVVFAELVWVLHMVWRIRSVAREPGSAGAWSRLKVGKNRLFLDLS